MHGYSEAVRWPRLLLLLAIIWTVKAQCPWPKDIRELNGSCLCAYNLQNQLSIQCSSVNFTLLMTVLHHQSPGVPMDLLYVNNTRISVLNDRSFDGLQIENIQFSSCGIYNISDGAFKGLENQLVNLNLQDNRLADVPTPAFARLQKLRLLDLSGNLITTVRERAFTGLRLATLKLADNELSIRDGAFSGLESSLKNLNMKGTNQDKIPRAILNLPALAFLDLAQNQIRSIEPGSLANLHSLTALNLERNLLQSLEEEDFLGVNDTLSSLSLLNNLITFFPTRALNSLSELRVLDVGFNLLSAIPDNGFMGVGSLTLLALDGNPLTTVPEKAFNHLNTTLRGLSIGGRFLHCDCRVGWISRWISEYDLQVTSRERNPQFCGQPPEFRERSFYQLEEADFVCGDVIAGIAGRPTTANRPVPTPRPSQDRPWVSPPKRLATSPPRVPIGVLGTRYTSAATSTSTTTTTTTTEPPTTTTTTEPPTTTTTTTRRAPTTTTTTTTEATSFRPGEVISQNTNTGLGRVGTIQRGPGGEAPPGRSGGVPRPPTRAQQRPSLIERPPSQPVPSRPNLVTRGQGGQDEEPGLFYGPQPYDEEVIVQDAYRKDSSVIIQWDSEVSNILGFRVVYRLFGDKTFKLGPPLAASEREFKIKNVPTQECIVVCVVSLEDAAVSPDTVEYSQCREIRTETSASMHMDTIIIAASAAICGTVIIAVIVFICCNRKRNDITREKHGIPAVLSPASPPLASLGTLGSGLSAGGTKTDWDTLSMYSQRSIPRARMYHMDKVGSRRKGGRRYEGLDSKPGLESSVIYESEGSVNNGFVPDDTRSHISHISSKHIPRPRSMADGQSQRSYSALSNAQLRHAPSFSTGLGLSRQDLSMSRQSLSASMSGFGPMAVNPSAFGMTSGMTSGMPMTSGIHVPRPASRATSQRSGRRHSRSKSRERERASSRLSHAGSTHSLTGYDTDGWTDHDMDIYVARNPTRGGLVQL